MRTCLVSSELAPFSGWGVGTATASLARALTDAGNEVHVLTDEAPRLRDRGVSEFPGVTLHALDWSADAALDHHPCRATRRPFAIYQQLRALHARHRFESIQFNDFYADAAFVLDARRTLGLFDDAVIAIHLHSAIALLRRLNGQIEADLEAVAVQHLETQTIKAADQLLSPSHAMLDKLREILGTEAIDPDRSHVIPYAFDVDRFLNPEPSNGARTATHPEILFFGRLEYRKGAHLLTAAAQQLLDSGLNLRVRIVGADTNTAPNHASMRTWLTSRIAVRWRSHFVFEDNRPRTELVPLIRSAAACCVPSLWENFPNVCLEAMSLGATVVAAESGGIPEIITPGQNGLLFRANDSDSLAQALRVALTDRTIAARCASNAPARIRELCNPAAIAQRIQQALIPGSSRPTATPPVAQRVTAVIPFYNLTEHLPEAIESLRAQTRPPDEILIVDDGSTQAGASDLLSRYEREGIRVIRKPNGGLPSARNAGFAAATSRWVLPLDADDTLHPRFIESTLAAAARLPSATVVTAMMKCYSESPDRAFIGFVPFSDDHALLPVLNTASSAIALVNRAAVLDVGGYDETFFAFEDWDLWCSLAARGAKFVVVPEYLIYNRVRPTSMLRTLTTDQYHRLRARLLVKHEHLSPNPALTLRMMLAESMHYQHLLNAEKARPTATTSPAEITVAVRHAIATTPRYRFADRLNDLLKRTGLQPLFKSLLGR